MIFKFNYVDMIRKMDRTDFESVINCMEEILEDYSNLDVMLVIYKSNNSVCNFKINSENINIDNNYLYIETDEDINDYLDEEEQFKLSLHGRAYCESNILFYTEIDRIIIYNSAPILYYEKSDII